MENNTQNEDKNPKGKKVLTEDQFKKMVENDLTTAVSFLGAVRNDAPTMSALNEFLYGRYLNQLHKAELEQQTKIEA